MWCYCTPSKHHVCDESIGKVKCSNGTEHCVIGKSGKKKTQSCWEWPNTSACPNEIGPCYLLGTNTKQPACCCKGNLCNDISVKYSIKSITALPFQSSLSLIMISKKNESTINWISISLFVVLCFILLISVILISRFVKQRKINSYVSSQNFKNWNRKINNDIINKTIIKSEEQEKISEKTLLISQHQIENLYSWCDKKQLIAQGRFGQIWRGIIKTDGETESKIIAIKIFADNKEGKKSWENESLVYSLLRIKPHPNILKCFGAEKRKQDFNLELWLVVEYYPLGSLWNYLKKSTVNWKNLLHICQNIAAGLTHLHCFTQNIDSPIAHRDIKSKNILLKEDFTACIADFGLAICQKSSDKAFNNRVGTLNYMAPEILEGSINFDIYSFLRIDVFSMSLVFWEVLSRCEFPDLIMKDFQNPFQDSVGENPTFEEIRHCVTNKKLRPTFNPIWNNTPDVSKFWKTITECWDEDPDARLNADCVLERMNELCSINSFK